MSSSRPIALVGGGAISEEFYLPAFAKRHDFMSRLWLVEPNQSRRSAMAGRFGIPSDRTVDAIAKLPDETEAAFNATPSHLHLSTTLELLARNIHVFLEKPLGETASEGERMVAAAGQDTLIGVNQYRRLIPIFAYARARMQDGSLGILRRIEWNEGNKFAWPAQSPFYFRRPWADGQPRGAVLDAGAHIFDLFCWWLGGEPEIEDVRSDGFGGPEAYCSASLKFGEANLNVRIGMHVRMANRFTIEGDRMTLSGSIMDFRRIFQSRPGEPPRAVKLSGFADRADIAEALVQNFMAASAGKEALLIDAASVLPSLRTIDQLYRAMKSPLPEYYEEWRA